MSNSNPVQSLLAEFIGGVEELLDRYRSLEKKAKTLHDRNESLEDELDELRRENQGLKETIDQQQTEFNELAGELKVKFGQIKDEATKLLSERSE